MACLVYLVYLDNIYSFGMEESRRWRLELSSFGTGSEATPGTSLVYLVCLDNIYSFGMEVSPALRDWK